MKTITIHSAGEEDGCRYCRMDDVDLLTNLSLNLGERNIKISHFVCRYLKLMEFVAGQIVGTAEADDVVIEVLLRLVEKSGELHFKEGSGSLKNWLSMVVRNQSISHVRANRRIVLASELMAGDDESAPREFNVPDYADPSMIMVAEEQYSVALKAVESLPPKQKEIVELAMKQGMTDLDYSLKYGVNINTIRARHFQAKNHLKAYMDEANRMPDE